MVESILFQSPRIYYSIEVMVLVLDFYTEDLDVSLDTVNIFLFQDLYP